MKFNFPIMKPKEILVSIVRIAVLAVPIFLALYVFYPDEVNDFFLHYPIRSQQSLEDENSKNEDWEPPRRSIEPQDLETFCQVDQDCLVVHNDCSGCCEQVAISKQHQEAFQLRLKECVKEWRGPVCKCVFLKLKPVCQSGRCQLIEIPF